MHDFSLVEALVGTVVAALGVGGWIVYCLWRAKKQTDNLT
jgi:hypothetical protein